jgi:hypothetical protein
MSWFSEMRDAYGPSRPDDPKPQWTGSSLGYTSYADGLRDHSYSRKDTIGRGSSYYGGTITPSKTVIVVNPNGSEDRYTLSYDGNKWFDLAAEVWPAAGNEIRIPVEHCAFTHEAPRFNSCVYTATNNYMQSRWGRKLDDYDLRWLSSHPMATDDGVPQEYTATCIDQLVKPYGMRVSRIRIRRGSLVLGDNIMAWIQALGCNHFALADRSTTNAEAAARLGITEHEADLLWRVEFHDDPLPCSIVGERGLTSTSQYQVGAFGGHAKYQSPRAPIGDWFVSVQLDMDHTVSHVLPPPDPEYVPRKGKPTLSLAAVTRPDKQPVAIKISGQWQRPNSVQAVTAIQQSSVVINPTVTELRPLGDYEPDDYYADYREHVFTKLDSVCHVCTSPVNSLMLCAEGDVCYPCVDDAWEPYSCPHCAAQFKRTGAPDPLGFDEKTYDWQCKSCKGTVTVPVEYQTDFSEDDCHLTDMCFSLFIDVPMEQQLLPPLTDSEES